MARITAKVGLGTLGLLALGAPRLAAQSWALPASDPVSIARSGTGVAYGANLEAAGLNPALLATLREEHSLYLAAGMEMQVSKATLQANQSVAYSSDRNRFLPALGGAWRLGPTLVLGLKLDEPFMRHAQMPTEYAGVVTGQALDLRTRRLEASLGWAYTPNLAFGASLGATRIQYSWDNMVSTEVANGAGTPLGMMQSDLRQTGATTVPSYSLGFRWAPNSRWTLGGAYVGSIKATLPLTASYGPTAATYAGLTPGYPPYAGIGTYGPGLQAATAVGAGQGGITLPGKLTLGVRQRLNQLFTWELDLRYILSAGMALPGYPSATAPGKAPVTGVGESTRFRNGLGGNLMGELNLSRNWVLRVGAALDPAYRADNDVDPLVGGAKSAGFSGGFGYKVFGGEVNVGYQYRQAENVDTPNLQGTWSATGYSPTPASLTRVEGMGHLWSAGYKVAF